MGTNVSEESATSNYRVENSPGSFVTLVHIYQTKWLQEPDGHNLNYLRALQLPGYQIQRFVSLLID
jgi:hypothetical protein